MTEGKIVVLCFVAWTAMVFAGTAFISWGFDPAAWHPFERGFFIFVWLALPPWLYAVIKVETGK